MGLIFPIISWLTLIGSLWSWWRRGKHTSSVFIPFVGPLLLTGWIVLAHKPLYFGAIIWTTDIGTLAFLAVSPRLIRDWWQTSSFTKILELHGNQKDQRAILTLHSNGHYVLKKTWHRPHKQPGITALGEPGTFTKSDDQYRLVSHVGLTRILEKTDLTEYVVREELLTDDLHNYSLNHWTLSTAPQ